MVAVAGVLVAVLAITDPLKPEARGVVTALHQMGLMCHLLTGDNWRTARAIAEQLGVLNVSAECLPGAKSDKIKVHPQTYLLFFLCLAPLLSMHRPGPSDVWILCHTLLSPA